MSFFGLLENQDGATAIEYALVASLIAIAAVVGMQSLGSEVNSAFESTSSIMKAANG